MIQLDTQFAKRLGPQAIPGPPLFSTDVALLLTFYLILVQMKVSFQNEPGEGSGVVRAFYTSFAEALISLRKPPFNDENDDSAPLFYQVLFFFPMMNFY